MNSPHSIREKLISSLSFGPKKLSLLIPEVASHTKTTIQGVYKSLRLLRKEEVITVHKKVASLSIIYLEEEIRKLEQIRKAYRASSYIEEIQKGSKSKAIFKFSTFYELDLFWTHFYITIEEGVPLANQLYMIIPHDWFLYLRTSTDTAWVNKLAHTKRASKMLITHAYTLDKKIALERKKILGKLLEYGFNHNPLKQKEEEYYNIVGPWIFIAKVDKTVSHKISHFLKDTSPTFNEKDKTFLDKAVREKGIFSLTIIHSDKKANLLTKKVKNYFTS